MRLIKTRDKLVQTRSNLFKLVQTRSNTPKIVISAYIRDENSQSSREQTSSNAKKEIRIEGKSTQINSIHFPPTVLLVTYRVRITTIVHRLYTTPLESYGPSGCDVKGQLSHSSVASYSHAREETSAPIDAVSGLVFSLFLFFFFSPTRHGWIGRRRPIDVIA